MVDSLPTLTFGRVLGGLSTSILFSVPEAWLVSSAREHNLSQTELAQLLGRCTLLNGVSASLCAFILPLRSHVGADTRLTPAGVAGDYLVGRSGTFKSPFIASGVLLVIAGFIISAAWEENYGRAEGETACSRSPWQSSFNALRKGVLFRVPSRGRRRYWADVWSADSSLLILGMAVSTFESAMYLFVFLYVFPYTMGTAI